MATKEPETVHIGRDDDVSFEDKHDIQRNVTQLAYRIGLTHPEGVVEGFDREDDELELIREKEDGTMLYYHDGLRRFFEAPQVEEDED